MTLQSFSDLLKQTKSQSWLDNGVANLYRSGAFVISSSANGSVIDFDKSKKRLEAFSTEIAAVLNDTRSAKVLSLSLANAAFCETLIFEIRDTLCPLGQETSPRQSAVFKLMKLEAEMETLRALHSELMHAIALKQRDQKLLFRQSEAALRGSYSMIQALASHLSSPDSSLFESKADSTKVVSKKSVSKLKQAYENLSAVFNLNREICPDQDFGQISMNHIAESLSLL